ncbi:MAG: T9SS type A sorting domain-containing protein [Barnesiella sp.]
MYNLAGALVAKKANVNAMSTTIDLNDLVRGIYFVKVNNGNAVKVIKK